MPNTRTSTSITFLSETFWFPWAQKLRYFSLWSLILFIAVTFTASLIVEQFFPKDELASRSEWVALRLVITLIAAICSYGILNLLYWIERDLNVVANNSIPGSSSLPVLDVRASNLTLFVGMVLGIALGMFIDGPQLFFRQWAESSLVPSSLLVLLIGPMLAYLYIAVSKYSKWLTEAANAVEINFLYPDEYEPFSNPFLRMLGLTVLALSAGPAIILFSSHYAGLGYVFVALGMCILPILLLKLFLPLMVLRRKILKEKDAELGHIYDCYKGSATAVENLSIFPIKKELSLSDVMAYETRIRQMWDIPIAPRYHKFLIICLLPPTTWILAGLLENLLNL